jgi:hypothetical protein
VLFVKAAAAMASLKAYSTGGRVGVWSGFDLCGLVGIVGCGCWLVGFSGLFWLLFDSFLGWLLFSVASFFL